jgi:hypothetical protein
MIGVMNVMDNTGFNCKFETVGWLFLLPGIPLNLPTRKFASSVLSWALAQLVKEHHCNTEQQQHFLQD